VKPRELAYVTPERATEYLSLEGTRRLRIPHGRAWIVSAAPYPFLHRDERGNPRQLRLDPEKLNAYSGWSFPASDVLDNPARAAVLAPLVARMPRRPLHNFGAFVTGPAYEAEFALSHQVIPSGDERDYAHLIKRHPPPGATPDPRHGDGFRKYIEHFITERRPHLYQQGPNWVIEVPEDKAVDVAKELNAAHNQAGSIVFFPTDRPETEDATKAGFTIWPDLRVGDFMSSRYIPRLLWFGGVYPSHGRVYGVIGVHSESPCQRAPRGPVSDFLLPPSRRLGWSNERGVRRWPFSVVDVVEAQAG